MTMNKKLVTRLLCGVTVLIYSGAFAFAQNTSKDDYPRFEVFIGYSALGENPKPIRLSATGSVSRGYATPDGFEISVIRNFTRYIGLAGDFSAHFKNISERGLVTNCNPTCVTATQDFQLKTRVYNFLAGPEFKARNSTRFTPFAHVLVGAGHTSANFTTPGPAFTLSLKSSDTSFAMALGGGLDIRATKRASVRAQMDYNPVFVRGSTGGRRDLVRLSLGVLFH